VVRFHGSQLITDRSSGQRLARCRVVRKDTTLKEDTRVKRWRRILCDHGECRELSRSWINMHCRRMAIDSAGRRTRRIHGKEQRHQRIRRLRVKTPVPFFVRSYSGGVYTRLSTNHFQSARARPCYTRSLHADGSRPPNIMAKTTTIVCSIRK